MKVALVLFALPLLLLFCPLVAELFLELRQRYFSCRIRLNILCFMHLKAEVLLTWLPLEAALYINGRRVRLKMTRMRISPLSAWRGIRVKLMHITGDIGLASNGAGTVIAAGIINELQCGLCIFSCADDARCDIRPAFDRNVLCINLEGIAQIIPAQIIFAEVKRQIITKREETRKNASC